jgi:hypothetical protein
MAQPTTSERTTGRTTDRGGVTRTPVQKGAGLVGVVFLLVGIAGFIPGITQNLDTIEWVGHESEAELLGLFRVNILHNLVHLAFGLIGLWAARTASSAKAFLIGGGVVYLALWLYGLVIDLDSDANFVALNTADNWLHLGLGAGMILLGLVLRGHTVDVRDRSVR